MRGDIELHCLSLILYLMSIHNKSNLSIHQKVVKLSVSAAVTILQFAPKLDVDHELLIALVMHVTS